MNQLHVGWAVLAAATMAVSSWSQPMTRGMPSFSPIEARQYQDANALSDALQNLTAQVQSVKIAGEKTVKDFLAATEMPKDDQKPLLQGAVQYPPVFYADGSEELRVALPLDALRKNLAAIKEKYYKKADGEFAAVAFDKVGEKDIEASGKGMLPPSYGRPQLTTEGIPGWENVGARKRIDVERAAYEQALGKLRSAVEALAFTDAQTVGQLAAQNATAKQGLDKFFESLRPSVKAYLQKGIVRITFDLGAVSIFQALEAANAAAPEGAPKVDAAQLKAAQDRAAGKRVGSEAWASVSGQPVNASDIAPISSPIKPEALAGLTTEQGK